MGRLKRFDYKSPYFYMVTLKRLPNLAAFSQIGPDGLVENELTRAFNATIRGFYLKWRCCEAISSFVVHRSRQLATCRQSHSISRSCTE